MLFNLFEVLDIVLMTLVIGYIFKDTFRLPVHHRGKEGDDILDQYRAPRSAMNWHDFWWGCALVAPAIILHELGHKFMAMSFGLTATFHAACSTANLLGGLGQFFDFFCGLTVLSVVLKTIGFGFIFFVPGYVSIGAGGTEFQNALISFAGPAVHLIFWLGAAYILRNKKAVKKMSHRKQFYLFFFKQINMFLFILNMLPIPGFDGFSFFYHLIKGIIGL